MSKLRYKKLSLNVYTVKEISNQVLTDFKHFLCYQDANIKLAAHDRMRPTYVICAHDNFAQFLFFITQKLCSHKPGM